MRLKQYPFMAIFFIHFYKSDRAKEERKIDAIKDFS